MKASNGNAEAAKLRSVARQYRSKGYRVVAHPEASELPAFLEGYRPDLLARGEIETVIVEIKRTDAVRGSNDLVWLADRVSREPGWRFELVAIPSVVAAPIATGQRMQDIVEGARAAAAAGLVDVAYLYAHGIAETFLEDLARENGLSKRVNVSDLARDLVSKGVLSSDVYVDLKRAGTLRNAIAHGVTDAAPSIADVEEMLVLVDELRQSLASLRFAA